MQYLKSGKGFETIQAFDIYNLPARLSAFLKSTSIKLIGFGALFLIGCYYDKEEILYPESANCTSISNPSFSADVLPLLNTKCNNCHAGSSASAGIRLDSFTEVIKHVNNGTLMGSINQTSGFSPMPKNGSKMSLCEIQKIQDWITAGAGGN
jgi:hypothetical protein